MSTPVGRLIVQPSVYLSEWDDEITISWANSRAMAGVYASRLSAGIDGKQTSVVALSMNDTYPARAVNILNTLIDVYNDEWVHDKNRSARNTTEFINERLVVIEQELGGIEMDLREYKEQNKLTDINAISQSYLDESSEYASRSFEVNNQLSIAQYIRDYLTDPKNANALIPANSGLTSANIESQISEYNQIVLQRDKLIASSSEQNPLISDLTAAMQSIKTAIIRSIDNLLATLNLQADKIRTDIGKERKREEELTEEYEKEKDSLNQELGANRSKLKEILQTRKTFEAEGIDAMLALADRETTVRQEEKDTRTLLDGLLKTHETIEEKYNVARGKLENARRSFENAQKEAYCHRLSEIQKKRDVFEEERTKNRNIVTEEFDGWRHESDERLQNLIAEQNRADSALKELRKWHPMADEMKHVDEQLMQLDSTENTIALEQKSVKSQIDRISAEYEMKDYEMRQAFQRDKERLEADRRHIREQIAKIGELLSRLDGSLYNWLCENKEGWENTIGKVVDVERILYAQGMEPQSDAASDRLFGVRLNLDNIASVHRTPDDYRAEKKELEEQDRQIGIRLDQSDKNLQDETSKLTKKYTSQLNPLRQEATALRVREGQIPTERQNLQNLRHKLEMEEQKLIADEKEIRERSFNEALLKVQSEKDARTKNEEKHKKSLRNSTPYSTSRQRLSMRSCAGSRSHNRLRRRNATRSSTLRRISLTNSRMLNLPVKASTPLCSNSIAGHWTS